jgi:hypothetical protein
VDDDPQDVYKKAKKERRGQAVYQLSVMNMQSLVTGKCFDGGV